jgi:muconate cycloisomerase
MSRIVRVETARRDYGFQGEFKFFKPGPDGVVRRPSVLVRLTDEEGNQGWGQAVPVPTWTYETVESVETSLNGYLASAILGEDPQNLPAIHRRMEAALRPGLTVGMPLAKAAIDLACYDLAGKAQGRPVSSLLGGAQLSRLELNWTVNATDMASLEQQLQAGRTAGYRHYTVKLGPPQTPDYDLQLVQTVRRFAPESFMWADANTGYDVDTALDILPRLADAGLQAMESPLPPMDVSGYQSLKRQNAVPIYMDEGIIAPEVLQSFIDLEMLQGVTLKPARTAGLWRASRIVSLAKERGLGLLGSGLTDPDLSLAGALHLYAWAGMERPCALNGPQFLVGMALSAEDGSIAVPRGPGLGLDMGFTAGAQLHTAAALD